MAVRQGSRAGTLLHRQVRLAEPTERPPGRLRAAQARTRLDECKCPRKTRERLRGSRVPEIQTKARLNSLTA